MSSAAFIGLVSMLLACGRDGAETGGDGPGTASVAPAAASSAASIPVGTYRYDYPMDSPELVEDQFIVIDSAAGSPRLWYYGTSDEFDTAREGYRPAFFVAEADSVRFAGDSLSFELTVPPGRYVRAPVPLAHRSAAAAGLEAADSLIFRHVPAGPARYAGRIIGGELMMSTPAGARRYTRMD